MKYPPDSLAHCTWVSSHCLLRTEQARVDTTFSESQVQHRILFIEPFDASMHMYSCGVMRPGTMNYLYA